MTAPLHRAGLGDGSRVFVIAEAGVNHNGDLRLAHRLVEAAVDAGADAVKFQTFTAEKVVSRFAPMATYQANNTKSGQSQLEMVRKLELPFAAFRELQADCHQRGIVFASTAFDFESLDFLATLDLPFFKVPSGEITNFPFLEKVARFGKPLIVSTGMSQLEEVGAAVKCLRDAGNDEIVLLQCTSNYPTAPADVNLRAMATLRRNFALPVGYSDHTLGITIAIAAAALGASVIEKHFTLDRSLPGPDHAASLDPDDLRQMVRAIRDVEAALGSGRKVPAASELNTAAVARRSLVAACDLPFGTILTREMVAIKRPGTGLPPSELERVLGRTVRQPIPMDALILPEMLA